jgi:hypothetical protein
MWLKEHRLSNCAEKLAVLGVDGLLDLPDVEEQDLRDMGFSPLQQRRWQKGLDDGSRDFWLQWLSKLSAFTCTHTSTDAASEKPYDAETDEEDVIVEVVTSDGGNHKFTLPPTATVLKLKQSVEERDAGFESAGVKLYVHDVSREEELKEGERMGSLRRGKGLAVLITMMKPSVSSV